MHLTPWKFLIAFSIAIAFSSCQVARTVKRMHETRVDLVGFWTDDKQVYFIPMIHVAKPDFYLNVQKTVDSFKKLGYVVFHEGVKRTDTLSASVIENNYTWLIQKGYLSRYNKSENKDSIISDVYRRKFRKLVGFYYDSLRYASMIQRSGLFKGMVDQPRFNELTIDERDIRVDVTRYQIIDAYEQKFGFIELSVYDMSLTLGSTGYRSSERVPVENLKSVILKWRDEFLANAIESSPDKKILVLYGAAHVEGTFENLRKMNASWKRND